MRGKTTSSRFPDLKWWSPIEREVVATDCALVHKSRVICIGVLIGMIGAEGISASVQPSLLRSS